MDNGNGAASSHDIFSTKAAITITASLLPYEKKLLDNFRTTFWDNGWTNRQVRQERCEYAFSRWQWSRRTQQTFEYTLTSGRDTHNLDWTLMWAFFVRHLGLMYGESNFSRVDALKPDHDPDGWDFSIPILKNIKVIPDSRDLIYWQFIAELLAFFEEAEPAYSDPLADLDPALRDYEAENNSVMALMMQLLTGHLNGRPAPEISERQFEIAYAQHWDFQIWSLVRSCTLLRRRRAGSIPEVRAGLWKAGFYERHTTVRNGFILKAAGLPSNAPAQPGVPSIQPRYHARAPLSLKLGSFGLDPVKYVEYIPWTDLLSCRPQHLMSEFPNRQFVQWNPQQSMKLERLLYTEEDAIQFCVDYNVAFPDHFFDNHVIFVLSPIRDFVFESLMDDYWRHWVRIALARKPSHPILT